VRQIFGEQNGEWSRSCEKGIKRLNRFAGIYALFMTFSQLWRDLGCKAGSKMIGLPDALFMRRLSPLC